MFEGESFRKLSICNISELLIVFNLTFNLIVMWPLFIKFAKMKKSLHKILTAGLAFIVLFSSFSYTVEKHVCMGEVTSTSFFNDADSCGMIMSEEVCSDDILSHDIMQKEKCCNDIHELIPGNQTEQQAIDSFELSQVQFVLAFTFTYLNIIEVKEDTTPFIHFSPPIVDEDLQVLYQSFLI